MLETISDGMVDLRCRAINRYMALGYSKQEAILMTLDGKVQLQEALNNTKK